MGRFLLEERATWYFGGGRFIEGCVGATGLETGAPLEAAARASRAAMGFEGLSLEGLGRFEGRMGWGAGDWALSASVLASAAARSAARAGEEDSGDGVEVAEGGGGGALLEAGVAGSRIHQTAGQNCSMRFTYGRRAVWSRLRSGRKAGMLRAGVSPMASAEG
jgi:hypothetical protein